LLIVSSRHLALSRFFGLAAVNQAVFFSIIGRLWSMCAGLVTAFLIASFFSSEIQGYYYTFLSVLALQVFAELGLATVITSYASHEWASLTRDANGRVTGDKDALSRLSSLTRFALKWYLVVGLVAMVSLLTWGLFFFDRPAAGQVILWRGPWLALCIITGINLWLMPIWALLEGCNQVNSVYRFRLIQAVVSSSAGWCGIYFGCGLWVTAIIGAGNLLVTIVALSVHYRSFLLSLFESNPGRLTFSWTRDILPMQWRVSVSWLSGYFSFSLFTPILFYYHGSVAAGKMGMTWAFIAALTSMCSSWTTPYAPMFGMLAAQRKYVEMDRLLLRLIAIVSVIAVSGAAVIWGGIAYLNHVQSHYAERMLSPTAAGFFLIATVILIASLPISTYLRAHKREPLLGISLANGVLTAIAVWLLGKYYTVEAMAGGYLLVIALVTPFIISVLRRCRIEWHK
jgi:O-antigen/teichoic acid export membrane protein